MRRGGEGRLREGTGRSACIGLVTDSHRRLEPRGDSCCQVLCALRDQRADPPIGRVSPQRYVKWNGRLAKPIPGLIVELGHRHDGHPSPGERGGSGNGIPRYWRPRC
jgi:hypothetical protein